MRETVDWQLLFVLDSAKSVSWIEAGRWEHTFSSPDGHLQAGHDAAETVVQWHRHTYHRHLQPYTQTHSKTQ